MVLKKKSMKTKKKTYKRAYKRKPTINKSLVDVGLGFPKRIEMTHKYFGSIDLSSTTGVFNSENITCNGMYRPDTTSGSSHQPLYFDQLSALYNRYTVIGSKIDVSIIPKMSLTGSVAVGLFINDDGAITTNTFPAVIEQSLGVHGYMIYGTTYRPLRFRKSWSAKKTYGGGKEGVLSNPNLQGTPSANPTELQYYTLWAQTIDGTSTASLWCEFTITYIAVWQELKDIAQS